MVCKQALRILSQKKAIIGHLTDDDYRKKLDVFFGASVGDHIRHSVNHFETLLSAAKHSGGGLEVHNYDKRCRNTLMESERKIALQIIDEIATSLPRLRMDTSIHIGFVAASEADETFEEYGMQSTVARELSFVAHHSVHHLSTIRLMMNHLNYPCNFDDNIGKAPSTLRFDKEGN